MAEPLILPEREDADAWPTQGNWTYEDYCLLPDDGRRYEVIRGHLYVSPAPTLNHQRSLGELYSRFRGFVLEHGLGEVLFAPVDVLLPNGIAAPVQPDLLFFRTGNKPQADAANFQGVPDLVAEVLSRRTRRIDTGVKLDAYRDAGVPEVWFADPRVRTIRVHGLSTDGKSYAVISQGGEGESVESRLLPGLRIAVSEIFPR